MAVFCGVVDGAVLEDVAVVEIRTIVQQDFHDFGVAANSCAD